MHVPRALLFATTLSLMPMASAQDLAPPIVTAQRDIQFASGDALVRRFHEGAVAKAAWSRDGGRTWQPLGDPDDRLHFLLRTWDPIAEEATLPGMLGVPAGNRLFIVQFQTQILSQYRDEVTSRGVEILQYLPENALFVRCDRNQMLALRQLGCVRWVGDLQNGFKLSHELRAFLVSGATEAMDCNLVLAKKADRQRLATDIAGIGGRVKDLCDGSAMIMASLTPAQLQAVMGLDSVTWADPTTAVSTDMDNARIQGGGNYVQTAGGYTGTGVRAEITEAFAETHADFQPTATRVLVRGANAADSHGHCTAGIVAGSGAAMAAARGMMPTCTVIEGNYLNLGSSAHYAQITGSTNPAMAWRTMVATASWGSAVTTAYTSVSVAVDDALFDSDLTRFNSQSNQNSQLSRPEAWAKNIISGGGIVHGNNSNPADDFWQGASYGPASDGRLKPDICAYYENVHTSDLPGASGYSATDYYTAFSGTSSATPICAGHMGLIQQMFTDGLFKNTLPLPATAANRFQNKPHMTTSKALLCNTAAQYSFVGAGATNARVKQGWGFPDLRRLYDNRRKIVVVDEYEALTQGQSRTYLVWVAAGTPEFRATMAYADPQGTANSAIHRVNNVNLSVTRLSDGMLWWGNNGLSAGNFSTAGGVANDRDTMECVYLQNPAAGIYLVTVTAASVVQDGKVETPQLDVDYALVMHPVGGGYHDNTVITLDLVSSAPGDLRSVVTGVPAAGWTDGMTLFAFNTSHAFGFGRFFGIEDDFLTVAIFNMPAVAGDVFHFTNTPGAYPFTTHTFPPSLVMSLAGIQVDGMVMLFNAGQIVGASNVDRITLQ
jgi:hypothetical protein